MIPFSVQDIVRATGGVFFGDASLLPRCCRDITINSRTAGRDSFYVPVIGERFDGHAFIEDARNRGCLCVLSDRPLPSGPYILVPNVLEALQKTAHAYRCLFDIPLIGVTGSVGKTSTKEMLAAVIGQKYSVLKTEGSLNNQTGVPQILFRLEREHQVAVIEMGTNHPGEIGSLARMAEPTVCLFTNIGVAHIEFFGSREGILRGKAEMLSWKRPGAPVLCNGDDDLLRSIPGALLFGTGKNCSIRAGGIEDLGLHGIRYRVSTPEGCGDVFVPQPGIAGIYNSLAAIAAGLTLGMDLPDLIEGVRRFQATAGRMCVRKNAGLTVLDDAYNANPESMRASLDVLEKSSGRRVAILGDMRELGKDSPLYHFQIGQYAAGSAADLILCTGSESKELFRGAESVCPGISLHYPDRDALVADLPNQIRAGDSILVKASRGSHLEAVVPALLEPEFSPIA